MNGGCCECQEAIIHSLCLDLPLLLPPSLLSFLPHPSSPPPSPLLPHSSYPPLLLSPSAFLSPSPFSSLSPSLFSFSLLPPLLPLLLPPLSLTLQPQVLSSHLLPTQREVDEVFRRNFLEAGGLKSVINVLQRNALPSDVDLTIRQDCYAIALSLAR